MSLRETERAIKLVKDTFEKKFIECFGFERVSAPLFVRSGSGINDDLNGVERPVTFDIKEQEGVQAEIVHSLAKWKRYALHNYGFGVGEGLYTDMNAIRRDDHCDNTHSIYVDQWDWEMVISREQRNLEFLKDVVTRIIGVIADTAEEVKKAFPQIKVKIKRDVAFVTSLELEKQFPKLSPKEREAAFVKKHKTAFIIGIGGELASGDKHDGRAPDYDDWSLNGDIFFWNAVLREPLEISSMGIRVDSLALRRQLEIADCEDRLSLEYHKLIINETLPLSIGGGIGQSRLCMLLLEKAHIGEVQVSIWPKEMMQICKKAGIPLL